MFDCSLTDFYLKMRGLVVHTALSTAVLFLVLKQVRFWHGTVPYCACRRFLTIVAL